MELRIGANAPFSSTELISDKMCRSRFSPNTCASSALRRPSEHPVDLHLFYVVYWADRRICAAFIQQVPRGFLRQELWPHLAAGRWDRYSERVAEHWLHFRSWDILGQVIHVTYWLCHWTGQSSLSGRIMANVCVFRLPGGCWSSLPRPFSLPPLPAAVTAPILSSSALPPPCLTVFHGQGFQGFLQFLKGMSSTLISPGDLAFAFLFLPCPFSSSREEGPSSPEWAQFPLSIKAFSSMQG